MLCFSIQQFIDYFIKLFQLPAMLKVMKKIFSSMLILGQVKKVLEQVCFYQYQFKLLLVSH